MSELNDILTATFGTTGALRSIATQQNVKLNGILARVDFTPNASYLSGDKYKIFKNIRVTGNLRRENGNTLLFDSIPLLPWFMYSDSIGGVGLKGNVAEMKADELFSISAYLPIGYFDLGGKDSLDFEVNCSEAMPFNVTITLTSSFDTAGITKIRTYKIAKATGSDQTFADVIGVYVHTDETVNQSASIKDQSSGQHSINIETCISKLNAVGRFEMFTRFGELFVDPFDLGQSVTLRVPPVQSIDLLVISYAYDLTLLAQNFAQTDATKQKLITEIINAGGNKVDYLKAVGVIS